MVFGLARSRIALGDIAGAIDAYERIPSSSSVYVDAQVAKTEALLDTDARPVTVDDVLAAGSVVEGLTVSKEIHVRLSAGVLERRARSWSTARTGARTGASTR